MSDDQNSTPKYQDAQEASRIYFLPNLFTSGNLFFGFLAIIRCIQARYTAANVVESSELYTQAVWYILLAFICDAFDGRVARISKKESLFGKEFDSIADVVSFGVAPALMTFFLILSPTEGYPIFRQLGWVIGFIYLLCAGIRLARFNVLTHPLLPDDDRDKNANEFTGLPVPAAAAVIASLVLVLTKLDIGRLALLLPPLMLLIAWLMISTIPYPSFKKIDWDAPTRFRTFIGLVIVILLAVALHEFSFAIISLGYIFYGLVRHLKRKYTAKRNGLK